MTTREPFPDIPPVRLYGCVGCAARTSVPVPVRFVPGTSGPGYVQYACPNCVTRLLPGPTPGEIVTRGAGS